MCSATCNFNNPNPLFCFQFRPKHNPLAWPLAPPAKDPSSSDAPVKKDSVGALNPNVPEFVPSFGGIHATSGGDSRNLGQQQQPGMTPFSAVSLTRLMDKG